MLCTKFLLQSLFWFLDQKPRKRNFEVQRSNAALAIQKSVLIFGKELVLSEREILVTILLPEFITDQAVRLALSSFGEVVSVLKGRHI